MPRIKGWIEDRRIDPCGGGFTALGDKALADGQTRLMALDPDGLRLARDAVAAHRHGRHILIDRSFAGDRSGGHEQHGKRREQRGRQSDEVMTQERHCLIILQRSAERRSHFDHRNRAYRDAGGGRVPMTATTPIRASPRPVSINRLRRSALMAATEGWPVSSA